MMPKNYNLDFCKRSKELLETMYPETEKKGLEFTFLINCLMGLVVIVKEKSNDGVFSKKISQTELGNLLPSHFQEMKVKEFLRFLRNAIAHQDIEAIGDKEWDAVKIKGNIDLELSLEKDRLKEIAIFLADEYLNFHK